MPDTGVQASARPPCAGIVEIGHGYARAMALEVRVNRARCIATQSCMHAAQGVFELDEQRIATVRDPEAEPLDAVVEAAESCPTGAISVFRDGVQLA